MRVQLLLILTASLAAGRASRAEPPLTPKSLSVPQPGLVFVENQGQWSGDTRFLSRGGALPARLEADGASLLLRDEERKQGLRVRMSFEAPARPSGIEGIAPSRETYNFILGQDRSCWASDVAAYSKVVFRDAGSGIDVAFHEGDGAALEYDVLARPGADLSTFAVRWDGVDAMRIDGDGSLVLTTKLGELRQPPPRTWQEGPGGSRIEVECRYRILDEARCGFEAELADPRLPLVIDPVIQWARRLGGAANSEAFNDFVDTLEAVDEKNVLVGGQTSWSNGSFPGAWDALAPGVLLDLSAAGGGDDYIGKLDGSTGEFFWLTFLGGSKFEGGVYDIALKETGEIIAGSWTGSDDWPVTNASTFRGGKEGSHGGSFDACVATLSADGKHLLYSTYLGGAEGFEVAQNVLPDGDAIIASGVTASGDFPITEGAFKTRFDEIDNHLQIVDGFVVRLAPDAGPDLSSQMVYSTYLGGTARDFVGYGGQGMALLPDGSVAIVTSTESRDFPTTQGAYRGSHDVDDFDGSLTVLRLDSSLPAAEQLLYSTYLGGPAIGVSAAIDGTLWIMGSSGTTDFLTTANAFRPLRQGTVDGYVLHLRSDGRLSAADQLLYASYLGGSKSDFPNFFQLNSSGEITLVGNTDSPDYPLTSGTLTTMAAAPGGLHYSFVTKLDPSLPPAEQLIASTLIGNGEAQNELYSLALLPEGRVIAGGQIGQFSGSLPGFPRFTAPPSLNDFAGFIFAINFCEPHAVIAATGSPATGMTFSAADSTTQAGTTISSIEWDFGDGATASGVTAEHTFGPGRHVVTLTVANDGGCSGTATRILDPVPCPPGDVAPWIEADVGAGPPTFPSSAELSGSGDDEKLSICSGGVKLAAKADDFHLVSREIEGDAVFTARLESFSGGDTGAKAGITLREGLEPGARNVALVVERRVLAGVVQLSYRVHSRLSVDANTTTRAAPAGVAPAFPDVWLRLQRAGDNVAALVSTSGLDGSWTEITSTAFPTPLEAKLHFGFATAGADPGPAKPYEPLEVVFSSISLLSGISAPLFRRGDANASGRVDISDAVSILGALFLGGEQLPCLDAADSNDDGRVDLSDAVADLSFLFLGSGPTPPPGPEACGPDPTAEAVDLGCQMSCP